jgi:hypothetical protein
VHEDYAARLRDRAWAHGVFGAGARVVAAGGSSLARHADVTVVADGHLPPRQARRRVVVRNLPDLSALPAPGPRDARPRALYVGDVRRSRGLQTMLEAVEAVPEWTLDVVGPVAADDAGWLADWSRRSPAAAAALNAWAADPAGLERCRDAARSWATEHLAAGSPYDELADVVAGLLPGVSD